VLALCGVSGSGKSTLAAALARRGHAIVADDAVAIDVSESVPTVIPLPFATRLHPDAAAFLAVTEGERLAARATGESAPLASICVLRRSVEAAIPVAIDRLAPATACEAVIAHAYCFSVKDAARRRRTVENYLTIATRVPVYELRFRPGLESFTAVLGAIEELIGCVATEPR
jgi:predicted ATPase